MEVWVVRDGTFKGRGCTEWYIPLKDSAWCLKDSTQIGDHLEHVKDNWGPFGACDSSSRLWIRTVHPASTETCEDVDWTRLYLIFDYTCLFFRKTLLVPSYIL